MGESGEERSWPQILAILVGCLIALSSGVILAWPSPSIPRLLNEGITLEQASYFTVIAPVSAVIFSFPAGKIGEILGRKRSLLFIAVPHLLSWTLVIIGGSLWVYYASRFVAGISDALTYAVLPGYIAEISSAKVRGFWGNSITFLYFAGTTLVNVVGSYCDVVTTAYIMLGVPAVFLLAFSFMPESPYHLVAVGKEKEAKEVLQWLRRKSNVDKEYLEITKAPVAQATWSQLWSIPANKRALLICVITRFTQQFGGISAFSVYCHLLFAEAGGEVSPSTSSITFNLMLLICAIVGSIVQGRYGRRKAMLASGLSVSFLLFILGTYLYLRTLINLASISWMPLAIMILFIVAFTQGLALIPNLMLGEVFSSSVQAKASAVVTVFFGLFVASSTKIFQVLLSEAGLFTTFYFYGACCLLGTVLCYFVMIETKGKTLEEIQCAFKGEGRDGTTLGTTLHI